MSAPDPRAELASLAAGLAAELRRAEWRGCRFDGPASASPKAPPVRAPSISTGTTPPSPPGSAAPGAPIECSSPSPSPSPAPAAPPGSAAPPAPASTGPELDPTRPVKKSDLAAAVDRMKARAGAAADVPALRAAVAGCTACELARSRTQTVFADGTGRSGVVFVGEAPGYHEDQQGVPFVGRAGQLLTDIIEKGMGLAREDVLICNVLKCRPPENRDPTGLEKALCTPWLDRQLDLAEARIVIALGRHAAMHLIGSDASMARLRGQVHTRGTTKIVATYHPAFLLRSPHMKKDCWQDIQLAMREIGLEPPPSAAGRRRG